MQGFLYTHEPTPPEWTLLTDTQIMERVREIAKRSHDERAILGRIREELGYTGVVTVETPCVPAPEGKPPIGILTKCGRRVTVTLQGHNGSLHIQ